MPARPSRALETLLAEIHACRLCRDAPLRGRPLPHEPRPVLRVRRSATLCIAGQAPGTKVHATGLPFNDASGDRLRSWMAVDRDTFYDATRVAVVPMGFCFPGQDAAGGDLPPRRECAPLWRDRVMAQLPNLRLILAVGGYSHRYHVSEALRADVTATVERFREVLASSALDGPNVLPLPHPSWRNTGWLKRNPWFESELLPVLRAEVMAAITMGDHALP
ncbi:MAG: uracil-DNA glycosylase family protein [Bauldia sp.]